MHSKIPYTLLIWFTSTKRFAYTSVIGNLSIKRKSDLLRTMLRDEMFGSIQARLRCANTQTLLCSLKYPA